MARGATEEGGLVEKHGGSGRESGMGAGAVALSALGMALMHGRRLSGWLLGRRQAAILILGRIVKASADERVRLEAIELLQARRGEASSRLRAG